MKVKRIFNSGKYVNEQTLAYGNYMRETEEVGAILGEEYYVYGMALGKPGNLIYLLAGNDSVYQWLPAELFEVVDSLQPVEQYFCIRESEEEYIPQALWGYKELIEDPDHYLGLWQREPKDQEIFRKAKRMIDKDNDYEIPPEHDAFTEWLSKK